MGELSLLENDVQKQPSPGIAPSDSWKDSPAIQHLLDAISSIIAKEFITIAKQNLEVFLKQGVKK